MKSSSILAKKPNLLDPSRIKFDVKKIFSKLGEAAMRASIATPPGVNPATQFAVAAVGTIESISLKDLPSEKAWYLVKKSVAISVYQLLDEWIGSHKPYVGDIESIENKIELTVENEEILIDLDFFRNPSKLRLISRLSTYLSDWSLQIGLNKAEAHAVSSRFESYFISALHDEWRLNRDYYSTLLDKVESPFEEARQLSEDWDRYKASICRAVDIPVFGEVFSLRQIYIPLRASYQKRTERKDDDAKIETIATDGAQDIKSWLDITGNRETISVIRGGPGSGKSSLLKMLAFDLVKESKHKVLFFPLQRFSLSERLVHSIGSYLNITGAFSRNPLEQPGFIPSDGLLVLMFDGLDELTKPGELAEIEAKRFLSELRTTLAALNLEKTRVVAIVSGRTALIQASRDALRLQSRRELSLLKFFLNPIDKFGLSNSDNILDADQRLQWWEKYAILKNETKEMPKFLLRKDVEELSAEPLLIYLLVASGFHKGDLPADFNRNSIYERLLYGVLERPYEKDSEEATMSHNQLAEVLEAIATAAWYGDGRTATVDEIRAKCSEKVSILLDKLISGMGGMHKLVASFYFQESEKGRSSGKESFEFTHKSFGEYLTAKRVVRQISIMNNALALQEDFYTIGHAAKSWYELCSPAALDFELLRFIHDELRSPKWSKSVESWAEQLGRIFQFYLDKGVVSEVAAASSYRVAETKMRNSEEALLVIMSSCAEVAKKMIVPKWVSVHSAGSMVHRIVQQRYAGASVVALNISMINFDKQNLMNQGMTHTKANEYSFEGASFYASDLRDSVFNRCNFKKADLSSISIDRVVFRDCDLTEAKFDRVRQHQAPHFLSSVLRKPSENKTARASNKTKTSDFGLSARRTSFVGCKLPSASFLHADLIGADFKNADLTKADFRGAFLHHADLSSAVLESCNFTNSKMTEEDAAFLSARGINITKVDTSLNIKLLYQYNRHELGDLSILQEEDLSIL